MDSAVGKITPPFSEGDKYGRQIAQDSAPDILAALKDLYLAYVQMLEAGRDRIISLGGDCDPVDVMEDGDRALSRARAAIAQVTSPHQTSGPNGDQR